MTRILINGTEVELPVDLNLAYNTENTLFTKSSVWTGELVLSMQSAVNRKVFKSINRMETRKELASFPAKIYVDGNILVEGTAKVIEVTNKSVSLQILAGNAEVNNKTREDEMYLDELDLGRAFDGLKVNSTTREGLPVTYDVETSTDLMIWANQQTFDTIREKFWNDVSHADCVVLPAQSAFSIDDSEINNGSGGTRNIHSDVINMPGALFVNKGTLTVQNDQWLHQDRPHFFYPLCPQPYLVYIIEKVVSLLGYEIMDSALRSKWTRRIYIPNVRKTLVYKDMMPHWSVNKFLTEVENLLGVVFLFDEKSNRCDILDRDTVTSDTTHLRLVDDIYTTQVNDGDNEDISSSNIEFGETDSLLECFSEDIVENANFKTFSTFTEMANWFNAQTDADVKQNTICVWNNRHFISYGDTLTEGDQLRKLEREGADSTVTLAISPAKTTLSRLDVREEMGRSNDYKQVELELGLGLVVTPFVDMGSEYKKKGARNIEGMINGYTYNDNYSELSIMPIAIAPEASSMWSDVEKSITLSYKNLSQPLKYCFGWTHGGEECTMSTGWRSRSPALRLVEIPEMQTLYNACYSKQMMTKNVETEISFFDEGIFDPRFAFIIRGKKYVCKNIEYTIGIEGFERKKTGIFYQIE